MSLSYAVRFLRSLLTLAIFSAPAIIAAIAAARRSSADVSRRVRAAVIVALVIICAGALVAASDAVNREGWNPAFFGGPFVGAALPAAVFAAAPRGDSHRASMMVLSIIAAFPYALLVSGIAPALVRWAFDRGLPVTW